MVCSSSSESYHTYTRIGSVNQSTRPYPGETMKQFILFLLMSSLIVPPLAAKDLWEAAGDGDLQEVKNLVQAGVNINQQNNDQQTPLWKASYSGFINVVRYLLDRGARPDLADEHGMTPLMIAATGRHIDVVKLLIARGASPKARDKSQRTVLMYIAKNRHVGALKDVPPRTGADDMKKIGHQRDVELVNYFVRLGVGVDDIDKHKETALMYAAAECHETVARALMALGAKPTLQANNKFTPLTFAARHGCPALAQLFIDRGVDVNTTSYWGTALLMAAEGGHFEIVKMLHQKGARLDEVNDRRRTALMLAAGKGWREIVMYLLANGANPALQDFDTKTALDHAKRPEIRDLIKQALSGKKITPTDRDLAGPEKLFTALWDGKEDEAIALINKGVDVKAIDKSRRTPLHAAAVKGLTRAAELLIKKGAAVDARASDGTTPLCSAAYRGHYDVAKLLVDKGADVNVRATQHNTPLTYAEWGNNVKIIELIKSRKGASGESYRNLYEAIDKGDVEEVEEALKGISDINAPLYDSLSALHLAARGKKTEIVKTLIQKGADVNRRDRSERTPLHLALESRSREIAEELLKAKANPNLAEKGRAPMIYKIIHQRDPEMLALFLRHRADITLLTDSRNTTLHEAVSAHSIPIMKILIEKGAAIDAANTNDETPLHRAVSEAHPDAVELLLKNGADMNRKQKDSSHYRRTPLGLALWHHDHENRAQKKQKYAAIVRLLESRGAER